MSNKVKILMGYQVSNNTTLSWGEADLIAEVETEGTDSNGYPRQETLGVCKNEYGDYCIFRGSTDRERYEECTAIIMNQDGLSIGDVLLDLAMKVKKIEEK